jgi:hypothetical protein
MKFNTDVADPIRAKLRIDTVEPICRKSRTLVCPPILAKFLKLSDEPKWTEATTLTL